MDTEIVTVFCLCDDLLKADHPQEDQQVQLSDAEIMTMGLVVALYFGGNYAHALRFLVEQGYLKHSWSGSRFSRRWHAIKPFFLKLFSLLGPYWKAHNPQRRFAVDTFPIRVCDYYRIPRGKIYRTEAFRGYPASKKRYFYGLKLHLLTTEAGQPVEFFLTPGSYHDGNGLFWFDFDLPDGALIVADKIYNNYKMEDVLDPAGLHVRPFR